MSEELFKFLVKSWPWIWEAAQFVLGAGGLWMFQRIRRMALKRKVLCAYSLVQRVREPETMNPDSPGNPAYMKSQARDFVNLLLNPLKRAGLRPPEKMERSEESIEVWFRYLSELRSDI